MHFIFQFPLIDLRPLIPNSGRNNDPQWTSLGENEKKFIRRFGQVKKRRAGGSDDWAYENFLCDARNFIQFDQLQSKGFSFAPGTKAAVINSYRRFFSDGKFLGKFEVGIVDNAEKRIASAISEDPSLPKPNADDVLRHYANLIVKIEKEQPNEKQQVADSIPAQDKQTQPAKRKKIKIQRDDVKLYNMGKQLANRYYLHTTNKSVVPEEKQRAVFPGEILLVVSFSDPDLFQLPAKSFLVESIKIPEENTSIRLHGYRFAHEGNQFKVWFIEMPPGADSKAAKAKLRDLRINLLRIHSEKETIRLIIKNIGRKTINLEPNSAEAIEVSTYFKKTAEKIFTKERNNVPQNGILQFALHSEDRVDKGRFLELESEIGYFQDKYVRDAAGKLAAAMRPKVVLFVCSKPADGDPLDFSHEYKKINDAVKNSPLRHYFNLVIETAVTSDEFPDKLTEHRPDVVHLTMHCDIEAGLSFEGSDGQLHAMSTTDFATIIHEYSTKYAPQVIVISACNSLPHAEAIKQFCDFSVGTKVPIADRAAIAYAGGFYQHLFSKEDCDVTECHEKGREAILDHPDKFPPVKKIAAADIPTLIHK